MNNVDINPSQGAPLWADRSLSGIAIAFLLFDAVIKLPPLGPVTDTLRELRFTPTTELARGLGVLLLLCTALYALPHRCHRHGVAYGLFGRSDSNTVARQYPRI